ncbi:hypothetical protein [Aureispira anguillae]|uniref:Uncharacterized protein n=1 Tax=Aureispira anguillae TaxID=2864201 RepID=A0A916DWI2_9BACT|nr:hypothetical protein [Aureispira anguillae]BDS15501.1 hypothetical protein AsAng_0062850 [Aureispira anguillae]
MKYLLFVALFISIFAVSCDDETELLTNSKDQTTSLQTHDQSDIENILNQVNANGRYQNMSDWQKMYPLYHFEGLSGEPDLPPPNYEGTYISPCTGGGVCGPCLGFCTRGTNILGKSIISGTANGSGVVSVSRYNNGYRLYSLTLVRHRQTGAEKIMFDFKDKDYFVDNGNLQIKKDVFLTDQMASILRKQNIELKAGIYPVVIDATTGNAQTIVDATIH